MEEAKRLIIAGGRNFNDYESLKRNVSEYVEECQLTHYEIVSGTANGADSLGQKYAEEFGVKVKKFRPMWNTYGKAAGPVRNEQMAKYATHCIVFWNGVSTGTKSMIDLAKRYGLNLKVIEYNEIWG